MWVFSRAGFFSAVRRPAPNEDEVCVRGRVQADFEKLRDLYFPQMGEVLTGRGTDYPYRVYARASEWAQVVERMAQDIDYRNFKGMVSGERGYAVANLYEDVWAVMYGAETKVVPERRPIPVDYASRHAPPFEEWRVEKGVEARQRAATRNEEIRRAEEAARPKLKPVPTVDPIEAFTRRYEAAEAAIRAKRKASKKAGKKAEVKKVVRGPGGRFTKGG